MVALTIKLQALQLSATNVMMLPIFFALPTFQVPNILLTCRHEYLRDCDD